MSKQTKTNIRLQIAIEILEAHHPMTVRQVYYQLVSRQAVENKRTMYQAVSDLLVDARKNGTIPWGWIEDRLRRPRSVPMWDDLADFSETVRRAYRRDVWATQPLLVECWLEKDALSGIFENTLRPYGVTLNVGRGYDGWDSIKNAAGRWGDGSKVAVIYFGDFDPSGEDMVRSLKERLWFFDCYPELVKCALTADDIALYNLPPDVTKRSDARTATFIEQHGDISVELDALPIDVLRNRIISEVERRLDLGALQETRETEAEEKRRIRRFLANDEWKDVNGVDDDEDEN